MTITLIVLQIVAAVMPLFGFARLLWRAQQGLNRANALVTARGGSAPTIGDFNKLVGTDIREPFREERRSLIVDVIWVAVGLSAGAVAGILPLIA